MKEETGCVTQTQFLTPVTWADAFFYFQIGR